jgi:ribosome-binding factor A
MTRDLQLARVYYTVHADTRDKRDAERALRRAKPFLRRQLAGRLQLRHIPELMFFHDDALEREDRVAQLLKEIAAARDEEVNKDN